MTAPMSSPIGGCGEDPAGRGARIRTVIDYGDTLASRLHCLKPIGNGNCLRTPGHGGGCIAPTPFPLTDISDSNPKWSTT